MYGTWDNSSQDAVVRIIGRISPEWGDNGPARFAKLSADILEASYKQQVRETGGFVD